VTTILVAYPPSRRELQLPNDAVACLERLGNVRLLSRSADEDPAAWVAEAEGCQIVVSERIIPARREAFTRLPDLTAFIRGALDVRNVDVAAASEHGVLVVRGTPGWIDAVCELLLATTIGLLRHVPAAVLAYRRGEVPEPRMGRQLAGSTIGVIGYGHLGRRMAELAHALHANVAVADPYASDVPDDVPQLPLRELLATSDVVMCLAAHTPETENLLDGAALAAMKPDAVLVNGSRGGLIDEEALATALRKNRIRGAVLDVGRQHDDLPNPFLALLPNVLATPHTGGLVPEAIAHVAAEICTQVEAVLHGREPIGALNWPAAYRLRHQPDTSAH
jgi:D-3-phosphoglycerate dehydrogenase / 2-oxoglutarate reductase